MLKMMNTNLDLLNKKYDHNKKMNISKFHEQVLTAWKELTLDTPNSAKEILNEYVLHNNSIKIGNKVIDNKFIYGVINLKIIDLLNQDLKFKSLIQLNHNMNNSISQLKYKSLISDIPSAWKTQIRDHGNITNIEDYILSNEPHIKINNCL